MHSCNQVLMMSITAAPPIRCSEHYKAMAKVVQILQSPERWIVKKCRRAPGNQGLEVPVSTCTSVHFPWCTGRTKVSVYSLHPQHWKKQSSLSHTKTKEKEDALANETGRKPYTHRRQCTQSCVSSTNRSQRPMSSYILLQHNSSNHWFYKSAVFI